VSHKLTLSFLLAISLSLSFPVIAANEGQKAVMELTTLNGAKEQYEKMLTVLSRSMQQGFNQGLMKAVQLHPVPQNKRKKASKILQKHFNDFIKQYERHMKKTMTWEGLVKNVYAPLYLKHFTVKEIKDIITFYKSPTGKKFLKKSPRLIQDASKTVNNKYGKQLNKYAMKLSRKKIDQVILELKPLQVK